MAKCLFAKKLKIKRKESDLLASEKAKEIYVRCRKCFNCQMTKRREEIQRVLHEAKYYKYHLMITLTYDNANIKLINIVDDILNNSKLLTSEKYQRLIEYDKIVHYIRTYDNENASELERFIYYELINKYATLHYKDIQKYLDCLKKSIKRDKELRDKDFKYYGAGEYPHIKVMRGRPHYHAIFLFNDIDLIKYFIKSWKQGNITIKRGDNQTDESINYLDINYKKTNADYLNCVCKQETKKEDINRIYNYIKNNKLKLDTNRETIFEVMYIAAYTNKKVQATLYESIRKRHKDIKTYYTIKNMFEEIEYSEIRDIMKAKRHKLLQDRKRGIISNEKEESFRFKSARLGYRYAIENKNRFIKDCTIKKANKIEIINDYYIKKIIEHESKNNIYNANLILYNKNKVISELKIKEVEKYNKRHNIKYSIKKYFDNSIDIIDETKDDNNKNIYTCEKVEAIKIHDDIEAKKIAFGEKEYKSDTFKIDYANLKSEIKKHEKDLNKYLLDLLNNKYKTKDLIKN